MKKNVAVVPIKMNNQRLPGKNTKSFEHGQPLIHYILHTLLETKGLDEIYVYCSKEEICDYLPDGVKFLKRSSSLDQNTTMILEVLQSFAREVEAKHYVLAHATAPFITRESIEKGLQAVEVEGYDSALTVTPCHDFLWYQGKPLNYDAKMIPRTQDLEQFYVETTGLYVYSRELILEKGRRTGENPYFIEVSKEEAIDINEPIDFMVANAWFQHCRGNNL